MITIKKLKISKSILNQVQEFKEHIDYRDIACSKETYIQNCDILGYVNLKDSKVIVLSNLNSDINVLRKITIKGEYSKDRTPELTNLRTERSLNIAYHLIRNGLKEQIYV